MARIFSTNSDYEPKYYGKRKQTAAQQEAAMRNLQEWHRLRSEYGMDKAKRIAERRRNLKKTFKNKPFDVPHGGTDAQDRFKAIMDSIREEDRDRFRGEDETYYDSHDILDVGTQWLEENDFNEDEYMDADEAEELLRAWTKWQA